MVCTRVFCLDFFACHMLFHLLFVVLLFFSGQVSDNGADWQLVKEKNGIQVYSTASKNVALKSIKVTGVFEGTPEKLWAIVKDVENQKEWVYGTKSSHLIKQISPNELLYYVETEVPWPVSNRDVPIRMKMSENKASQTLVISTVGMPGAVPANSDKVRVPHYAARWEVKAVSNDKIKVVYYLDLNPGGTIPAWVANMFVTKGPYETFANLRELLKK
jgi:hypothetical protein